MCVCFETLDMSRNKTQKWKESLVSVLPKKRINWYSNFTLFPFNLLQLSFLYLQGHFHHVISLTQTEKYTTHLVTGDAACLVLETFPHSAPPSLSNMTSSEPSFPVRVLVRQVPRSVNPLNLCAFALFLPQLWNASFLLSFFSLSLPFKVTFEHIKCRLVTLYWTTISSLQLVV